MLEPRRIGKGTSAILAAFTGWLAGHLFAIATVVFGAYSAYRVWDDRRPKIGFAIVLDEYMPRVRVFNLGKVPVVLEELRVLVCDPDEGSVSSDLHQQLNPSPGTVDLDLPGEVLDGIALAADLETTLRYRGSSGRSRWTSPQSFNLVGGGRRFSLRLYFGGTRDVNCPKCGGRAVLDVTGLNTRKEVAAHSKEFERELRRLCPAHDPVLMLREQREKMKRNS